MSRLYFTCAKCIVPPNDIPLNTPALYLSPFLLLLVLVSRTRISLSLSLYRDSI